METGISFLLAIPSAYTLYSVVHIINRMNRHSCHYIRPILAIAGGASIFVLMKGLFMSWNFDVFDCIVAATTIMSAIVLWFNPRLSL